MIDRGVFDMILVCYDMIGVFFTFFVYFAKSAFPK